MNYSPGSESDLRSQQSYLSDSWEGLSLLLYEGDSPLLDTVFTEAFVRQQLSKLRETLATGPDGIYARLLKKSCIYL